VLNQDELVVLFRCVICSLAAMSSRKQIPSIKDIEEKVTAILSRYDSNKDGQISLKEF
jgi:Ca2+-binding EF-hand superfamily protein